MLEDIIHFVWEAGKCFPFELAGYWWISMYVHMYLGCALVQVKCTSEIGICKKQFLGFHSHVGVTEFHLVHRKILLSEYFPEENFTK